MGHSLDTVCLNMSFDATTADFGADVSDADVSNVTTDGMSTADTDWYPCDLASIFGFAILIFIVEHKKRLPEQARFDFFS